jgi:hypothetical protein
MKTKHTLPTGEIVEYDDARPPGPKETGARNYAEVVLLRERLKSLERAQADGVPIGEAQARLDAEESERARAREGHLLDELEAARGNAEATGLAGEEIAGKPALAKYRRKWSEFSDAVLRLPRVAVEEGRSYALGEIARKLDADLRLFELDAPRGETEARERDRLRRFLDDPAFAAILMEPAPWADLFRRQFLSNAARVYLRPSLWRIYGRAPDEGAMDRLGTVIK